ncbi:MAG: alpha/beta hydrolase-fold protein, partial [Vicingaceae bacterium]
MKLKLLFTALLLSFIFQTQSQQTGSFNTSVMFNGESRTLSCYVPTDYDSSNTYKLMVGLHGMGDNSTNYRNALSSSAWRSVFPQTIFVFPDGGGADFYAEQGSEDIILEALDYAMTNYYIDSSYVVLQGFSLGGRSAMKFGLDHPEMFKGLLLNTPAVQGANDGRNDSLAGIHYDYSNANQIPIYLIVGEDDQLYDYTLKSTTIPLLRKNDAILDFYSIAGLGHNLPSWGSWMRKSPYAFFDNPASAPFDIHLFDADVPYRTCSTKVPVSCFIQNTGDSTVTSVEIKY